MKNLRTSSYLNYVDVGDGTSLLFNGSSLCIDLVPTEYANLLSRGEDLSFLSQEEKEHLLKRGHLTALTPRLELEEFRKLVRVILEKRKELDGALKGGNLTFILTYNCNLSCSYCFQKSLADKSKAHSMSVEFVDRFFSDYFSQLFPRMPDDLLITLFGGEPLLPNNRAAITRILDYAKERPSFRVSVSTNGTTLSDMTDLIGPERGKIQDVHVTLDGDRLLHDENRVPKSGKATFDAMVAAIRQLIRLKVRVSVRVHIHQGRLESAKELSGYLEKEGILGHPQVNVYFSPINTFVSEQNSPADFDTFCRTFQEVAARTSCPPSNLDFMDKLLKMQTEKVLPKVRFCGAGTDGFYVVDPMGDIYGCYEEVGHKDRRIGSFSQGKARFFSLKHTYMRRHLLNLPECVRCPLALFCGGGCPCEARIQKGSIFKSYCHQNKEFIAQTLKAFFLRKEVRT